MNELKKLLTTFTKNHLVMPSKKREVPIILDDNIEAIYGVKFDKLTSEWSEMSYDLIRFKCELKPTGTKRFKGSIFLTVASIGADGKIVSSSVIEIAYKTFKSTALIDTCVCANKDILSLNVYISTFMPC